MNDRLNIHSQMFPSVERSRLFENLLEPKGKFGLQHFRDGEEIGFYPFPNGVTNAGKTYLLDAGFAGITQITNWYLGLIDGTSGSPTLSNLDTFGSHSGWTEFTTYTEGNRQAWNKGSGSSGNTFAGTSSSVFTIGSVATGTFLAGGFVGSSNVKGGTTGTLWSTGLYLNPVPIQTGDVFRLGYSTGL